jgi:hypothetical protein
MGRVIRRFIFIVGFALRPVSEWQAWADMLAPILVLTGLGGLLLLPSLPTNVRIAITSSGVTILFIVAAYRLKAKLERCCTRSRYRIVSQSNREHLARQKECESHADLLPLAAPTIASEYNEWHLQCNRVASLPTTTLA